MIRKGGYGSYKWEKWLRKGATLLRGRDFHCMPHGFAQQARNAAVKRGIKVSISVEEAVVTITPRKEV